MRQRGFFVPMEIWFAVGALAVLAALGAGVWFALHQAYDQGNKAGSDAATLACDSEISKISDAAEVERRRISKIAFDLGLELAARQRALNQLAGKLQRESDDEIRLNPSPAVCDWSVERVRLVNEAARGDSKGRAGQSGS